MGNYKLESTSKTTHMTGRFNQFKNKGVNNKPPMKYNPKNKRFNQKPNQANTSVDGQKLTNNINYENAQKSDTGDNKSLNIRNSNLMELKAGILKKKQEELNKAKNIDGPINGNNGQKNELLKSISQKEYNLGNPSVSNQGQLFVKQPESSKIISKSEKKISTTK